MSLSILNVNDVKKFNMADLFSLLFCAGGLLLKPNLFNILQVFPHPFSRLVDIKIEFNSF